MSDEQTYTVFDGAKLAASGTATEIVAAIKDRFDRDRGAPLLIFEDRTGRQVDFDLRGTPEEAQARVAPARTGPGRPRLGVTAREVSLLPRHWEWLERQPNGASAALRRLVDEAARRDPEGERARQAIDAAGRFLSAMAGNLPGYEEATRALYRRDGARFRELMADWPADVAAHAARLVRDAF